MVVDLDPANGSKKSGIALSRPSACERLRETIINPPFHSHGFFILYTSLAIVTIHSNGVLLKSDMNRNDSRAVIADPFIQRKLIFLLSTILFFSVLNGTMFNVSLPDIAQDFRLLPSQVSWVMSGFIIIFAVSTATYSRIADIYSLKNLIVIGLILFNVGSFLGFFAQWYPLLIAARIVQASGCGAIPALGMLIATRYFPNETKGRVLGTIASTATLSAGIGPILGGFITQTLHWRYLFVISIITLATIPSFRRYLPDHAEQGGRFDTAGAILMAGAVGSFLLLITLALWWILPVSALLMICFLVHINRKKSPFLSPSLFRNRPYRNMVFVAFLCLGSFYAMLFMTPLMLRDLNSLGTGSIGLVMFPGAISAAMVGSIGGKFMDRKGSMPVAYTAMVLLIAGFFLLSIVAGLDAWVVALDLIPGYVAFTLMQSSLAHTVSSVLPKEELGIGMGMYNLFFFMSGAFSAAVVGKFLDVSKGQAPVNPLAITFSGGPYSNLNLLIAAIVGLALLLFYMTFRGVPEKGAFHTQTDT